MTTRTVDSTSRPPMASAPAPATRIPWTLLLALAAGAAILALPTPAGLPVAGQRMLAIFVFAVVAWITEAVSYEVSSVMIVALIALLVGLAPDVAKPDALVGTTKALGMALGGFASTALALVAAALVIAAAMTITGLDRRIALRTLGLVGTSTRRVLLGAIAVTVALSFVVPSATARTACVVPIMLGVIAAFGVDRRSRFAAAIMITVAQATSIWNIGIQTSAAQNVLAVGFMQKLLGQSVTWLEWLVAGAPWAIAMSVVLYFVVLRVLPPESDRIEGGADAVRAELAKLGPMTSAEWRLAVATLVLLAFWSTERILHSFDTTTTTIAVLSLLFLPGIGIMTWKDVQSRIPWGTVVVFGVGISLGTALLDTKAGAWLAEIVVQRMGLQSLSPFAVFATLAAFLIVIHLGFASATALMSAMLPIMISILQRLPDHSHTLGLTMLLAYTVSFGFVLPVNAPQNMVCIGTGTFTARQFRSVGVWVTLIGYGMLLLFAATWWRWLGWV
jgi:sodium-dependent dicarboxylate transporter 2/3/5